MQKILFGGNWSKIMAAWDDMPLADYLKFTIAWLSELKRVVRNRVLCGFMELTTTSA